MWWFLLALSAILSRSDALLNTTMLVERLGLPCQSHSVETRDGYVLNIFRIPSPGGFPVVFMPGFLSSSNTWVIAPKEQSIVAHLAEKGYDIWLLNYRGSYFGKRHVRLDPKRNAAKFWDFTFHEIGTIDIPSLLDYIEEATGFKEVLYVGHSMGCLSLYTMCTQVPNYCPKIRAAGLLAPVIFPPNPRDKTLISGALKLVQRFATAARNRGMHELFGDENDRAKSLQKTCSIPIIGKTLCSLSVSVPFQGSTRNVDKDTLPDYMVNTLSGTSIKLAKHMIQLMSARRFVPRFDYGSDGNLKKYGTRQAGFYNGTVPAPLIVFHSKSDPFTDQQAVDRLKKVSNVVYDKFIRDPTFNHINFVFSNDAKKYIINDLIKLFDTATNRNQ